MSKNTADTLYRRVKDPSSREHDVPAGVSVGPHFLPRPRPPGPPPGPPSVTVGTPASASTPREHSRWSWERAARQKDRSPQIRRENDKETEITWPFPLSFSFSLSLPPTHTHTCSSSLETVCYPMPSGVLSSGKWTWAESICEQKPLTHNHLATYKPPEANWELRHHGLNSVSRITPWISFILGAFDK